MNRLPQILAAFTFAFFAVPALAVLNVFATVPEWGALVEALGGDKVKVYTATNALQDPHHVEAKPSLIARARSADLVVATGAELEVGWLPLVLLQAGNPKVQPGKPGYFEAAQYVAMLEKPGRLDRADGDVHPGGNPHIQTDPRNIARVAAPLAARLAELDPGNAADYQARYKAFSARWNVAMVSWEKQASPLRGAPILVHHKAFVYLDDWLGLRGCENIPPSPPASVARPV
jgi:zinc/manganese transport system substrate-binding protein